MEVKEDLRESADGVRTNVKMKKTRGIPCAVLQC